MHFVLSVRRAVAVLAATAFVAFASQSSAQQVAESHIQAAKDAISAVHATDPYDNILVAANIALKQQLIQENPDLEAMIVSTIDDKTLEMAGRRADLEREVALAYARAYSEEQLKAIAAFYQSDAGKKLLSDGPLVAREVAKAAEIWQRGVTRDLMDTVVKELDAKVAQQVKTAPPAAPVTDSAAPAAAEDATAPQPETPELKGLDAPVQ